MNYRNVVLSFFVGAVIGLALQVFAPADADLSERVLAVLASSGAGLLIGFVTEAATALLPIRIARTGMYFFLNNLIALAVTGGVVLTLMLLAGDEVQKAGGWMPVVAVILVIVCVANLADYMFYRRAQRRLKAVQGSLSSHAD